MDQIKIGKFIASCRKEQGMTQAVLAEKLGIRKTTGRFETGEKVARSERPGFSNKKRKKIKVKQKNIITPKNVLKEILSVLLIIAGALMAGFSVACILLPNNAVDYGTAGIAIIINKLTNIRLSLCVTMVVAPFLAAGRIFLGRKLFFKAIVGTAAYTLGLEFFEKIPFELDTEPFLAVAFGGAILGAGLTLILRNGGCIDGSEILANIIVSALFKKTGRDYSMSPILLTFNTCVYAVVFIVINRDSALLSLLVFFIATVIIDHFTDRFEAIKQVTIITKDPQKIVDDLKNGMNKTCTVIRSEGAIAGENSTIICYVNYFELPEIKTIIHNNKGSFSTVSTVDEILR